MADSVYVHDDITVKQEPTSPRNNYYSSSPISSNITSHYVNNNHYISSSEKPFKDSPPNVSPNQSPRARPSMVPPLVSQRKSQVEDKPLTNGKADSDTYHTDESLEDAPLDFSIKRKLHRPKSRPDYDDEPGLLRQFRRSPDRSPPSLHRTETTALSRPVFPSTSPYSLPHSSTMAATSLSDGTAYITSSTGESPINSIDSGNMHHKTYVSDLMKRRKRHSTTGDNYASSSSSSSPDTSSNSHPSNNHISTKRRASPTGDPRPYQTTVFPGSATAALSPLSVIPGLPPGMVPNPALMGTLPSISAFYDPRNSHHIIGDGNKNIRPFKSYPKDPLSLPLGMYGIPGCIPYPSVDANTIASINKTTDELYDMYQHQINKLQEIESRKRGRSHNGGRPLSPPAISDMSSPESPPGSSRNGSPNSSSNHHQALPASLNHHHIHHGHSSKNSIINHNNNSIFSEASNVTPALNVGTISTTSGATSSGRKRPRSLPDEQKDEAYWERRRKNNEAAKRSRDSRRAKEDEIAIRAALLEQENLKLRVEVAALKNETAKLRCMLYNS